MIESRLRTHRYRLLILTSLIIGSAASVGMVAARFQRSGHMGYAFMVWNLVLAWAPLFFAVCACRAYERKGKIGLLTSVWSFLWLIFLPNAPYMITDLMHLHPSRQAPYWFDLILLLSFALTGLLLGYVSLYMMHDRIVRVRGSATGWAFVFTVLGLSSFGIYLGRFLRWNSWDLLLNPGAILSDVANQVMHPHLYQRTFGMSLSLAVMLTFIYLVIYGLTRIRREQEATMAEE